MHRMLLALVLGLLAVPASAEPVKIGDLGILADAPFYIAIEKGYFKEANVEVSLERFQSAAQATAPLSTNQVQVVGALLVAGLAEPVHHLALVVEVVIAKGLQGRDRRPRRCGRRSGRACLPMS